MSAEQELHQQVRELRETIAGLREDNARLQRLARQADAASKAKSDFLAMISHEIRTPMNGVIGLTELLLDTELDTKQRNFAGLILASARNLLTLINSLLDFSKIEAEMMELDIAEFDLRGQVGELMTLYGVSGQKKSVRVHAEIEPGVARAYLGDSYRIRQILLNLIGNGIKFTEKGDVVLRVKTIQAAGGREILRLEVQDSGPGIPADKMDRLFKPFSQVDSSSTRRYGGTGLGLSICQKLVELMGGEIGVESGLGQGSTFWFTLPLPVLVRSERTDRETVTAAIEPLIEPVPVPAAEAAPEEATGPLVLIVEDDETNQFVLKTILRKAGARVRVARNGLEAVELEGREQFSLIFMDCQMPVMDGFEATIRIQARAIELGRGRPQIIALTADATPMTRQRCREVGMIDYLIKPLDFSKLQQVLDAWLPGALLKIVSARHEERERVPDAGQPEDEAPSVRIDPRVLARLKQNMGNINPVIRVFVDSLPQRLASLEESVNGADFELARRTAHTLKGSSSQFGAVYLASLCLQIENMAKNKIGDGIAPLLAKIKGAAAELTDFLAAELDKK